MCAEFGISSSNACRNSLKFVVSHYLLLLIFLLTLHILGAQKYLYVIANVCKQRGVLFKNNSWDKPV